MAVSNVTDSLKVYVEFFSRKFVFYLLQSSNAYIYVRVEIRHSKVIEIHRLSNLDQ